MYIQVCTPETRNSVLRYCTENYNNLSVEQLQSYLYAFKVVLYDQSSDCENDAAQVHMGSLDKSRQEQIHEMKLLISRKIRDNSKVG